MKNLCLKMTAFCAAALATASAFASDLGVSVGDSLCYGMVKLMSLSGGMMFLSKVPSSADFNSRRVTDPSQGEVIRQRFYDSLLYPTAGQAQFTFFSGAIGSGITSAPGGTVGTAKTAWDTNLEMSNSLPSGKQFMIESIELVFLAGSVSTANTFTMAQPSQWNAVAAAGLSNAMNDVYTFYNSGLLSLNILSKNYLKEHTQAFPAKCGFNIDGAIATNSATTSDSSALLGRQIGRPYYMDPEITLQPAVNFEVTLTYPAAVATPSGFNGRVICYLDGYFLRASQ